MTKREASFWGSKTHPDISGEMLSDALAVSADMILFTDLTGDVLDLLVNPSSEHLGCLDHWIGRNIRDFLQEESQEKIEYHLNEIKQNDLGEFRTTELNHKDNADWDSPIRYTILHDPAKERLIFVGRDLAQIAEVQQNLVRAQLALESDYQSSRDYQTRYRAILESVNEALVLVNAETSRIEDLNSSAASVLGQDIANLRGLDFLTRFEMNDGFNPAELLDVDFTGKTDPDQQLTVKKSRNRLALHVTQLRSAGTRYLMCRLDVEQSAGTPDSLLSEGLQMLFQEGVDAIVFTNQTGIVMNCNSAFLDLCDAATSKDVINRPLSDFLSRGSVDQKMLIDGSSQNGQLRSYNTRVVTNYRSTLPVNVSATKLAHARGNGFGFVIRIMRSVENVQEADSPVILNANQNIAKLVGSSPLKEIVAGTTDVIEKICIETAIEMTGNNRVAAAEMLGLSRQSLYVKLRKFGMVDKSDDS